MKKLFAFLFIVFLSQHIWAQDYTKVSESDPKAKALLQEMRAKYEGYNTLQSTFQLSIEIPESKTQNLNGKLTQRKEKYVLELPDEQLYCNGATTWLYKPRKNVVQINDVDNSGNADMIQPQDLLRVYEWKDYVYVSGEKTTEKGKQLQQIEFKPLKASSDFFKIRLWVNTSTNELVRIKAFAKDGSRYTLNKLTINTVRGWKDDAFAFNTAKFPKVKIEDLRLD